MGSVEPLVTVIGGACVRRAPGRLQLKHFLLWGIQCLSDTPASPFSLSLSHQHPGIFRVGVDSRRGEQGLSGGHDRSPLVMVVYRCVLCLHRIRKEFTSAKLSVEVLCGSVPLMCSHCSLSFSDDGEEVRDVHFMAKAHRPVGP